MLEKTRGNASLGAQVRNFLAAVSRTLKNITQGDLMPRPPNYKQDKKRREDAQKKRNQQEQLRKQARKTDPLSSDPGNPTETAVKPEVS